MLVLFVFLFDDHGHQTIHVTTVETGRLRPCCCGKNIRRGTRRRTKLEKSSCRKYRPLDISVDSIIHEKWIRPTDDTSFNFYLNSKKIIECRRIWRSRECFRALLLKVATTYLTIIIYFFIESPTLDKHFYCLIITLFLNKILILPSYYKKKWRSKWQSQHPAGLSPNISAQPPLALTACRTQPRLNFEVTDREDWDPDMKTIYWNIMDIYFINTLLLLAVNITNIETKFRTYEISGKSHSRMFLGNFGFRTSVHHVGIRRYAASRVLALLWQHVDRSPNNQ